MSNVVSTDNLVIPLRAMHRSTGEMGTITALEPTNHGTYVHVTWDNSEAVELPSTVRIEYVELDPPAVMVSYYDATLALIKARIKDSGITRKAIAARMGWSTGKLSRKLKGETMLMVSDIGNLSRVLGCKMSDLVA